MTWQDAVGRYCEEVIPGAIEASTAKRYIVSFRQVAPHLDGPSWQTPLAARLGVAVRTVQRWAGGTSPMPDGLASELAGHLERKVGEAGALAVRLRRMVKADA